MSKFKSMKSVSSNAGLTSVNSKFKFKNEKILSSVASSNKSQSTQAKNATKRVDQAADIKRIIGPDKPKISPSLANAIKNVPIVPKQNTIDIVRNIQTSSIIVSGPTGFSPYYDDKPPPVITKSTPASTGAEFVPPTGTLRPTSLPTSLPTSDSAISLHTKISAEDLSVFRSGSFLTSGPSETDEKTIGRSLHWLHKPRVLSIVAENIVDGYAKSNLLVIKKVSAPNASIIKYTIWRKNLFKERIFLKLVELTSEDLVIPNQYLGMIEEMGIDSSKVFLVKDSAIKKNTSYAYKVQVDWVATGPDPVNPQIEAVAQNPAIARAIASIGSPSSILSNLSGVL